MFTFLAKKVIDLKTLNTKGTVYSFVNLNDSFSRNTKREQFCITNSD